MTSGEIEGWVRERGMEFYPMWPAMRGMFRGGEMFDGGDRQLFDGWAGMLGGLPVFGFQAAAGSDPDGPLYVVGVRLPGITFPGLTMMESGFDGEVPAVPIDPVFDLSWKVSARNPTFARDLVSRPMQAVLIDITPDFSQIWLERDAVLLSARGGVSATAVERYLQLLRRLVDTMPTRVLDALRTPKAPAPTPWPTPTRHPQFPPTVALPPVSGIGNEWGAWATRRGWMHYPSGREVAERMNRGPLPTGRHIDAFVGRFGELPCFGWRTITGTGEQSRIRQVLCIRRPGLDLNPVKVTLDDAMLTELVGSGDIEVGDPDFDSRWRVTSRSPESARAVLTPAVWKLMGEPFVPEFAQLWFEHDVAAVITDRAIGPDRVDEYLVFLHKLITRMGR